MLLLSQLDFVFYQMTHITDKDNKVSSTCCFKYALHTKLKPQYWWMLEPIDI